MASKVFYLGALNLAKISYYIPSIPSPQITAPALPIETDAVV